jgi:hypothetical protein
MLALLEIKRIPIGKDGFADTGSEDNRTDQ